MLEEIKDVNNSFVVSDDIVLTSLRDSISLHGDKGKSFRQIKDVKNSYLVIDTDYTVEDNKIPLWLFGFLY